MSNLRWADNDGLVIEIIKYGALSFHETNCKSFNDILYRGWIFDDWHRRIFQMLSKHGGLTQSGNWRSIAIFPILYKNFAKWLYQRLSATLLDLQCFGQYASIPDRRIEDVLFCIETMAEYPFGFNVVMDFEYEFEGRSWHHISSISFSRTSQPWHCRTIYKSDDFALCQSSWHCIR